MSSPKHAEKSKYEISPEAKLNRLVYKKTVEDSIYLRRFFKKIEKGDLVAPLSTLENILYPDYSRIFKKFNPQQEFVGFEDSEEFEFVKQNLREILDVVIHQAKEHKKWDILLLSHAFIFDIEPSKENQTNFLESLYMYKRICETPRYVDNWNGANYFNIDYVYEVAGEMFNKIDFGEKGFELVKVSYSKDPILVTPESKNYFFLYSAERNNRHDKDLAAQMYARAGKFNLAIDAANKLPLIDSIQVCLKIYCDPFVEDVFRKSALLYALDFSERYFHTPNILEAVINETSPKDRLYILECKFIRTMDVVSERGHDSSYGTNYYKRLYDIYYEAQQEFSDNKPPGFFRRVMKAMDDEIDNIYRFFKS